MNDKARRPSSNNPDDTILTAFNYNEITLVTAALEIAIDKLSDWNGPGEYLSMAEDMKPLLSRLTERTEEFL